MGNIKLFFLLIVLFSFFSCGKNVQYMLKDGSRNNETLNHRFNLSYMDPSGAEAKLLSSKTNVLMFAQEFCATCLEETNNILLHMEQNGIRHPLNKVSFTTLLVGATPDDAKYFKEDHNVPWTIGVDPNGNLFRAYCPQNTVPCLIIYRPDRGIILRHHGLYPVAKIIELTGPWE